MTVDTPGQVNYYEVLGANPMDQLDRIEDLFRQLAYEAETSGDHSKVPLAVEAFKVLRDPAARQQHDQRIAQQAHLTSAQQTQQVHPGQPQAAGQAFPTEQPQQPNPAAPAQYQPTPSQPTPAQPQQAQYQATPSQPTPAQPQQAQYQATPSQPVPAQPQPAQYQQTPSQPMPAQPQPAQYQQTPSQPMPAQPQPAEYQQTPAPEQPQAQATPAPEQAQAAQVQAALPEQPPVSIPNVQPESAATETAEPAAAPEPVTSETAQPETAEPPEFCPKTTQRRRREILAKFYKRRRDDAKNPGIAIGGLEQKVDYSYEVLEFHLWYMQQREWLLRLESGMFTITYAGVEEHEKNLIEGLI